MNKTGLANSTNHTFRVCANDSMDLPNTGCTETWWVYINITTPPTFPPTVNLLAPPNQTNASNGTVNHDFNFSDTDNTTASCTLYYNATSKGSNTSVLNWTQSNITSSATADGLWTWWVNCSEGTNSEGKSEERVITIDTSPPNVTFRSPTPQNVTQNYAWAYINVTINATASNVI